MNGLIKGKLFQKIRALLGPDIFSWLIITGGIILYLKQYLFNRSLWYDEVRLVWSIIHRSIPSFLHQPLVYNQAAPFGFLVVEKFFVFLFGTNEYALRLFPLVGSIVSLFLFSSLAKIYLKRETVPLAVFFFVVTTSLIYYSSEVKPYATDVTVALLLYVVIEYVCSKGLNWRSTGRISVLGALAIWFSFPAVFVLAGLGTTLFLIFLKRKEWPSLSRLSVALFTWLASFIGYYILSLNDIVRVKAVEKYFEQGYLSFPPISIAGINRLFDIFIRILKSPLRLSVPYLAGLVFLAGCWAFWVQDKKKLLFLLTPFLFTLLASALHVYSSFGKLVLFLVPVFLLLIVRGIQEMAEKTRPYSGITLLLLAGVLVYQPFLLAGRRLIQPFTHEEIKPVISYIKDNWQSGDLLYVSHWATYAFEYYVPRLGFSPGCYIKGIWTNERWKYEWYLKQLGRAKRTWLLFSQIHPTVRFSGKNEKMFMLDNLLKSGGKIIDEFHRPGASVYLFDLSQK